MYAVNELADCRGDWTFSVTTVNLLSPSSMLSHVQITSPTMDLAPIASAPTRQVHLTAVSIHHQLQHRMPVGMHHTMAR